MRRRLTETGSPCFVHCHGHCEWCDIRFRCYTSKDEFLEVSTVELYFSMDLDEIGVAGYFEGGLVPLKPIYSEKIWEIAEN